MRRKIIERALRLTRALIPSITEKHVLSHAVKKAPSFMNADVSSSATHTINSDEKLKSFVSVDEILNRDIEDVSWIIPDILPEGGIVLLAGPPAHFKTFLAFDMARCISLGEPFLGREVKTKTVFYIDKENPNIVQKSYLKTLGVTNECPLKIWPHWQETQPPILTDKIYIELAQDKPLMIFDSFIRFYPDGTDENSSTHMAKVMGYLRALTREGATVLILHHAGKPDDSKYRGSSDILGAVDMGFTIKSVKKLGERGAELKLECLKSRYSIEKDISIRFLPADGVMKFADVSIESTRKQAEEENKQMQDIWQILKEIEGTDCPNQETLIQTVNEKLKISEHPIRALLTTGLGRYWNNRPGGRTGTALIYSHIPESSSAPQHIYSTEELQSLGEAQEDADDEQCLTEVEA